MAKSRRKKKIEKKEEESAKKFWMGVGISTAVLLVLLFVMFQNS